MNRTCNGTFVFFNDQEYYRCLYNERFVNTKSHFLNPIKLKKDLENGNTCPFCNRTISGEYYSGKITVRKTETTELKIDNHEFWDFFKSQTTTNHI